MGLTLEEQILHNLDEHDPFLMIVGQHLEKQWIHWQEYNTRLTSVEKRAYLKHCIKGKGDVCACGRLLKEAILPGVLDPSLEQNVGLELIQVLSMGLCIVSMG